METKSLRRGSHRLLVRFSLLIVSLTSFVATITTTRADAAAELASFSVFDKVDLAQLAQGDAKTAHGPPSSGRYLSVQSCYVTKRTPAQEMAAMRNWNPGQHSELHVYLHNDLGGAPGPASFARLRSAPDTGPVRALSDATQKMSTDLQVSADEAKQPPAGSGGGAMPTGVATYWANLLSARAQAFLSGGSSSQRPYDHTGKAIRPGEELNGMLRQQEKIRHQFSGFLESTGIGRGGGGLRPDLYWELLEVEDQGVLTLGAAYNRAASGGAMQAADTLYYASGGYYAGLTLYQMWPVDVGGRPSTLVWRGDMISSASVESLHGIERVASESSMMRDISKSVSLFRRDTGAGR